MKPTIIITNQANKKYILQEISKSHQLYNLKFYTFNELKKLLYFTYDNQALEYIINNYSVNMSIAKIYLENLYFLKDIKDSKIQFLLNLKAELIQNNLLIFNPDFKNYLQDKKVVIFGANHLTKEQELILENFPNKEFYSLPSKETKPSIYEAQTINDEVDFIMRQISKLISNKVNLNHIKLIVDKSYYSLIKQYFEIYAIPLNMPNTVSYYSTMVAQEFLANYSKYDLETNLAFLEEQGYDLTTLLNIINKSSDIASIDTRLKFIINDLKTTYIYENLYEEAVSICSLNDNFSSKDYVFLLGFNLNSYPKIYKDEEYLSDKLKAQLGLDTSMLKNNHAKAILKDFLLTTPNLTITYKLNDNKAIFYPSFLIADLNLPVNKIEIDEHESYSKLASSLVYARVLDDFLKFNIKNPNLALFQNSLNIPYKEYNNIFKGINPKLIQEKLKDGFTLSYTNLEMYNECAFKYYLSKILSIDISEESFKTILGQIVHHVLELALTQDIDIPSTIITFLKEKEFNLNAQEYFYLEMLSKELSNSLNIIKKQAQKSKLSNFLTEMASYVPKEYANITVTFKGLIDKVLYTTIDNQEYLVVVDYKTNDTLVTLDNIDVGLNLQLPIYLYLLKNNPRFKDAIIGGFFVQKVLPKIPKVDPKKSYEEQKESELKLDGYFLDNDYALSLMDEDYDTKSYIKGVKYKNNHELYKTPRVLSAEQMQDITVKVAKIIDETIANIINAKYPINPKIIKNANVSCQYCQFKDICFKTPNDEVMIGGVSNEMDS